MSEWMSDEAASPWITINGIEHWMKVNLRMVLLKEGKLTYFPPSNGSAKIIRATTDVTVALSTSFRLHLLPFEVLSTHEHAGKWENFIHRTMHIAFIRTCAALCITSSISLFTTKHKVKTVHCCSRLVLSAILFEFINFGRRFYSSKIPRGKSN